MSAGIIPGPMEYRLRVILSEILGEGPRYRCPRHMMPSTLRLREDLEFNAGHQDRQRLRDHLHSRAARAEVPVVHEALDQAV
jgi:hypothetical protein